ncbi:hypothetical protein E4U42_007854 [Claviceps africana]|uniref:histone acetyltransferase n=1 Tax=Claviceps africana TaxID=83212 RepID=A0A8K0J2G6_9HYPO|nr:hypothetical protein E4U42_007854 [Claviceps africana]
MPFSPPSPPPSPAPSALLTAAASPSVSDRLASVLPKDHPFGIYHLSTPPQRTDALFSAPPDERPDRTYCEKHFLALSTHLLCQNTAPTEQPPAPPRREVLVLGLEIFVYTTAHSTTLFVSKADSTGYLPLLGLPRGSASPVREVCAVFIEYLVEHRRRAGIQFVVSLFARSQGQYLFPGSVDHGGKHVLDDRGLIKWWCRVLDPLLRSPSPSEEEDSPDGTGEEKKKKGRRTRRGNAQGYLLVPGLDAYETRAFVPHGGLSPSPSPSSSSWVVAHPLERISRYCRQAERVPPRCLIPRFPDDPKCRFRDELDDEAGLGATRRSTGSWKSVKTLEMFWEMMAYRQECSSGRMTGFIWIVLDDEAASATATQEARNSSSTSKSRCRARTHARGKKPKKLKGPIKPRQPKAKTQHRDDDSETPAKTTRYYHWPTAGRGSRIVNESTYKRITELMLHSDFSTLDKAVASTARWIREGGLGNDDWGRHVTGQKDAGPRVREGERTASSGVAAVVVNDLGGLVKRKRPGTSRDGAEAEGTERKDEPGVHVLGGGLVRKKAKTGAQGEASLR